jgi:hypothetical protein
MRVLKLAVVLAGLVALAQQFPSQLPSVNKLFAESSAHVRAAFDGGASKVAQR